MAEIRGNVQRKKFAEKLFSEMQNRKNRAVEKENMKVLHIANRTEENYVKYEEQRTRDVGLFKK